MGSKAPNPRPRDVAKPENSKTSPAPPPPKPARPSCVVYIKGSNKPPVPDPEYIEAKPTIDSREFAQAIADAFNRLRRLDHEAATSLVSERCVVNDVVANDSRFIVRRGPYYADIGVLGILNSMFSATHRIAAVFDDDREVVDFRVVDVSGRGCE